MSSHRSSSSSSFSMGIVSALILLILGSCGSDSDKPTGPSGPGSVARTWQQVSGPFTTETINDLWGSSSTNVYGVGSGGTVFHYDGNRWDSVASTGGTGLNAVWGSHQSDVYAVGDSGVVLHYNGSDWQTEDKLTDARLEDISGISLNKVVVVGLQGTVLSYDGIEWTADTVGSYPASASIRGVYMAPNGRIFICGYGYGGVRGVYEYMEGTLTQIYDTDRMLIGIRGASDNHMIFYDIDQGVYHYDGTGVTPERVPNRGHIKDIFCVSDNLAYFIQREGEVAVREGGVWTMIESTINAGRSLWMSSEQDIFASGEAGAIDHYDGSTWSPMLNGSLTRQHLYDVWCSTDGEVIAVGDSGTVVHYDGQNWNITNVGIDVPLFSVWGRSKTDVYAVGSPHFESQLGACVVLHYDGEAWTPVFEPTARYLWGISGNAQGQVFVAGWDGGLREIVYRLDQDEWTAVFNGYNGYGPLTTWSADSALTYLVGGIAPKIYDGQSWQNITDSNCEGGYDIWGAGRNFVVTGSRDGRVSILEDTIWTAYKTPAVGDIYAVWGTGPDSVIVASHSGELLVFDGTTWTLVYGVPSVAYDGIAGSNDGGVYVVGANGTILSYSR